MNRITRIGLIGIGVVTLLALILYFAAGLSPKGFLAFSMPFAVMILIGVTHRRNQ